MNVISSAEKLLLASNPFPLMCWAIVYFFSIYAFTTTSVWAIARLVNQPIDSRTLLKGQIISEISASLRSVMLFGVGMLVPWVLIKSGWAGIQIDPSPAMVLIDTSILILWNDLHFYVSHRFLHRFFRKFHAPHHKSTVATPFSAFSMSITEALLLGSVLPLAMLAHDFSLAALLFLPIWSIAINALAHSNCSFSSSPDHPGIGFILRHQMHHSKYHGNFSFFFGQLDTWFDTKQKS